MSLATDLAVLDHSRRHRAARRERGQLRRHRRAGRRGLGGRRRAPRPDDAPSSPRPRRARSPSTAVGGAGAASPASSGPQHPRGVRRRRCSRARRRSATARSSRSSSRSGSTSTARPTPSTSTGCCGPPTRARTCTSTATDGPGRRRLDVVGSSPEALVKVSAGRVITPPDRRHPAARRAPPPRTPRSPRSCSPTPRSAPSTSCSSTSPATTSAGSASPGSVEVVDFMEVERYSHVMHLVSTVEGDLAPGRTAYDVLQATFPAGTLSGAPKPRAMEIIDKLEPVRRGLYGGVVGYLDVAGDMDFAIAIRTALLRGRRRLRPGRRRDRRRLRPRARGRGVPQQGRRGPARRRDRVDAARPVKGQRAARRARSLGLAGAGLVVLAGGRHLGDGQAGRCPGRDRGGRPPASCGRPPGRPALALAAAAAVGRRAASPGQLGRRLAASVVLALSWASAPQPSCVAVLADPAGAAEAAVPAATGRTGGAPLGLPR